MAESSVFLVSGDIRTGKTTWLRHWIGLMKARNFRFDGVVSLDSTPVGDLNAAKYLQTVVQPNLHLRRLMNVETQQSIEFEIQLGEEGQKPVIKVGRFIFSKLAFEQGIQWLYNGLEQENTDWLVLDEVGKLELHRNEGFEPQLTQFFKSYTQTIELRKTQGKSFPKLLVLIRKELLSDFEIQHTQHLPKYEVIKFDGLEQHAAFQVPQIKHIQPALKGLIVGGGQSSRMGSPKFKKIYQNSQPQWFRLALAVHDFVMNIGINIPRNEENNIGNFQDEILGLMKNINESQNDGEFLSESSTENFGHTGTFGAIPYRSLKIEDLWDKISWEFDAEFYANSGPIGGILSYFQTWKKLEKSGLLVVAVDYPNLRNEALREMVEIHRLTNKSVFYLDDSTNIINGLIGVYSYAHLQDLEQWFAEGNQSLSRFLKQKAPEIYLLTPQNWSELKSVDE